MRINVFMFVISLLISLLILYAFYSYSTNLLYSLGSTLVVALTLGTTLGISVRDAQRSTVMVKIVSCIFFILTLLLNILFMISGTSEATFIITNGIAVCIWAIIVYSTGRTKQ